VREHRIGGGLSGLLCGDWEGVRPYHHRGMKLTKKGENMFFHKSSGGGERQAEYSLSSPKIGTIVKSTFRGNKLGIERKDEKTGY